MELTKNTWGKVLIGALITGAVYFAFDIIRVKLQTKSEKLTYYITETQPFPGRIEKGFYNIVIANDGEKPLSDVKAFFNIPNGVIIEWKVKAEATLDYTDTVTQDSILWLNVPHINSEDTFAVVIYAESEKKTRVHYLPLFFSSFVVAPGKPRVRREVFYVFCF